MVKKHRLAEMASYRGIPVLVTGGASFIGSHLVELLLEAGSVVRVADDLSSGSRENLGPVLQDVDFRIGDLRDESFAADCAAGQQIVFHLAAKHGGRGYIETHPVECVNNMVLDHAVFQAAATAGAHKLVYASTACVYPTSLQADYEGRGLLAETDANFEERGRAFADGEYGWAKLMGEMQLRAFNKQYGLGTIACRIFTAYGERENETHAVIALIAKAAARLDPYPIWGNGRQTRNFTYVADTVAGLALAGARLSGFETINVGSPIHHTIEDLIEIIFECAGWRPSAIERQMDKPTGVRSRAADVSKCRRLLGWEPQTSLQAGVSATVDWYRRTIGAPEASAIAQGLWERGEIMGAVAL